MSLHILSRRIRPLPYLRHSLQHAHLDGYRFMLESQWLSNSVAAANLRYGRQFWYDACCRNSKCEYRTWLSACSICKISPLQTRVSGKSWHLLCVQRHYASQSLVEKKSRRILLYLTALIFGMLGCTYAAVPLYRRFCQATGYGGTVQRRESVEEKIARHARDGTVPTREIVVYFNADVSDGMPWKFIPTQREVRVKPGESALAFYTAENRSSTPITGVSTYNVTPMKAAVYFNKIQCFCFEEQRLLPGEQIDMPVFFYIDPEFELDPKMDGINNLILSYTFFKVPEDS